MTDRDVKPENMTPEEKPTQQAVRACAEWLAWCLGRGWGHAQLDDLERLWWRHHDRHGRLK